MTTTGMSGPPPVRSVVAGLCGEGGSGSVRRARRAASDELDERVRDRDRGDDARDRGRYEAQEAPGPDDDRLEDDQPDARDERDRRDRAEQDRQAAPGG